MKPLDKAAALWGDKSSIFQILDRFFRMWTSVDVRVAKSALLQASVSFSSDKFVYLLRTCQAAAIDQISKHQTSKRLIFVYKKFVVRILDLQKLSLISSNRIRLRECRLPRERARKTLGEHVSTIVLSAKTGQHQPVQVSFWLRCLCDAQRTLHTFSQVHQLDAFQES